MTFGLRSLFADSEPIVVDPVEPRFCLCNQRAYGEMIICDNVLCPIEWFHFRCVQLTRENVPRGKWYCPTCKDDMKREEERKRRRNN